MLSLYWLYLHASLFYNHINLDSVLPFSPVFVILLYLRSKSDKGSIFMQRFRLCLDRVQYIRVYVYFFDPFFYLCFNDLMFLSFLFSCSCFLLFFKSHIYMSSIISVPLFLNTIYPISCYFLIFLLIFISTLTLLSYSGILLFSV